MHVTVRGKEAEELLQKALRVKEHELRKENFSKEGMYHILVSLYYEFSGPKAAPGLPQRLSCALANVSFCRVIAFNSHNFVLLY